MPDKVQYTKWAKRFTIRLIDDYDYYIFLDGNKIGAPMDYKNAAWVSSWLSGAMNEILNTLYKEG